MKRTISTHNIKVSTTLHAHTKVFHSTARSNSFITQQQGWDARSPRSKTSCAGGRHNIPRPCDLDLWPFDLESGVRVTCDVSNLCANFSLLMPLCSRLRPDVRNRQTSDRQTDVRQHHCLMPPTKGRGHNNAFIQDRGCLPNSGRRLFTDVFPPTRPSVGRALTSRVQSSWLAGKRRLPDVSA